MEIEQYRAWFADYAARETAQARESFPLEKKTAHSLRVLENAEKILSDEEATPRLARAGRLAALFHDLGRYEQYLRYGTFKDSQSINHGLLSARILKEEGVLNEDPDKALILAAIGLHNRRALPPGLKGDALFLTRVLRDADKIDIARVIAEHLSGPGPYNPTVILSLPDRSDKLSPKIRELILNGGTPAYEDLETVNDFRLLLGAWHFDLSFPASRALYKKAGHAAALVRGVPDSPIYREIKDYLLKILEREYGRSPRVLTGRGTIDRQPG